MYGHNHDLHLNLRKKLLTITDTQNRTNDLFNQVRQELSLYSIEFEDITVTQHLNVRAGQ